MAVTAKMVEKLKGDLINLKEKLEDYKDQKVEVLENEEEKDYPNEERIEKLGLQVDSLESAFEYLDEAIDKLDNYE